MMIRLETVLRRAHRLMLALALAAASTVVLSGAAIAQQPIEPTAAALAQAAPDAAPQGAAERRQGGEANLEVPDLSTATFLGSIKGTSLLMSGIVVCILGLIFGFVIYRQLEGMAVHRSMLEVSELIYATCKTYLTTQGRFILLLWLFIGAVITL